MNKLNILCTAGILALGLVSCEMKSELFDKGDKSNKGALELDLQTKSKGEITTSKTPVGGNFAPEDIDPNNYTVKVTNKTTTVVVYNDLYSKLIGAPSNGKLSLDEGNYSVEAFNYNGEKVDASARPFFKGTTDFQIIPGGITKVNTKCTLQNIEVGIKLAPTFLTDFFDDYTITATNGEKGNHIFNKNNIDSTYYFKVPATPTKSLELTIKATTKLGDKIILPVSITKPQDAVGGTDLKAGDSFIVTLNPGKDPITQYDLAITVDLTMTETGQTIQIPTDNIVFKPAAPGPGPEQPSGNITLTGLPANYTLTEAQTKAIVDINAKNGIQKLLVTIKSTNQDFLNTLPQMGLDKPFDLANPVSGSTTESSLLELGLISATDPIKGKTQHTFDVTSFMSMLTLFPGQSTFTIEVSDGTESKSGDLVVTVP